MRAREIMSSPVVTVPTTMSVEAAAELLVHWGFTALPVVDEGGRLVGIVAEADLIRNRIPPDPRIGVIAVRGRSHRPATVASVMTTSVESLTPGADVADAAQMMLDEHIRCFPVVDGTGVVGVITRRDLLRAAVIHDDQQVQGEVNARLDRLDGSGRFRATVQAGVVDIEDFQGDPADRQLAEKIASAVPGVVATQSHHQTCDPS